MKTRDKVIIGVLGACVAVAAGIWMEVRTCRKMRAAVEQALEMNRNFQPFSSDTIYLSPHSSPTSTPFPSGEGRGEAISLRRAVAYYNSPRWRFFNTIRRLFVSPLYGRKATGRRALLGSGGGGEALRAGYALGCVYRDLHEAPIAIITWEDAVAAADTTAEDCDYATLYRVYGQMADMYFRQYMPEKQLEAQQKFCDYALLAGDTLYYFSGLLRLNDAYLSLGDTVAVFKNIEHVRHLYLERGLTREAAQVYPSAIQIALYRREYEKADSMIQVFESESGLFDEHGNIERTREIYYYHKGYYFLGIHQLDSAEFQFRRLLNIPANQLNAYQGLMALFRAKGDLDSTLHYSNLYESALAKYLSETPNDAIVLAESMYDYTRQQQAVQEQEQRANRNRTLLVMITFLSCMGFTFAYFFYRRKKMEREMELHRLLHSYGKALEDLKETRKEVTFLQKSVTKQEEVKKLLTEKAVKIKTLESTIKDLQKRLDLSAKDIGTNLMATDIVKSFQQMVSAHVVEAESSKKIVEARAAKEREWKQLIEALRLFHPCFYLFITMEHKLSPLEYRVSILSYLRFSIMDMATLLNTSKQVISNTRASIGRKLFSLTSTASLDECLRKI